jgi:hypothetical protein
MQRLFLCLALHSGASHMKPLILHPRVSNSSACMGGSRPCPGWRSRAHNCCRAAAGKFPSTSTGTCVYISWFGSHSATSSSHGHTIGVLAALTLSWSCWPYTSALKTATSADSNSVWDSSSYACCGSPTVAEMPGPWMTACAARVSAEQALKAALPRSTSAAGGVLLLGVCSSLACLQTYCKLLRASRAAGSRIGLTAAEPKAPRRPGHSASNLMQKTSSPSCGLCSPTSVNPSSLDLLRPLLQKWQGSNGLAQVQRDLQARSLRHATDSQLDAAMRDLLLPATCCDCHGDLLGKLAALVCTVLVLCDLASSKLCELVGPTLCLAARHKTLPRQQLFVIVNET